MYNMKQTRKPQQPKTRSFVALASFDRPGGVHKDQNKRRCAKTLRRDKSYREAY